MTNNTFQNAFIAANTSIAGGGTIPTKFMKEDIGLKIYEYTNHLGNVLLTTNDKRLRIDNNSDNLIDSYLAVDLSKSDYYPYGMAIVGRNTNLSDYRFGYQGSEMDNEHKGNGNSYTTYFRQLDPRLGRWMSIDPVVQPWQSPYNSMDDNPIGLNDVLGDKVEPGAGGGSTKSYFGGKVKVYTNREGGSFLWVGNMSVKIPKSIGKIFNGAGKFGQAMKSLFKSAGDKGPRGSKNNPIELKEFELVDKKTPTFLDKLLDNFLSGWAGDPSNNVQPAGPDLDDGGGLDYRGESNMDNGPEFTSKNAETTDGEIMSGSLAGGSPKGSKGMKKEYNRAKSEAELLIATDNTINQLTQSKAYEAMDMKETTKVTYIRDGIGDTVQKTLLREDSLSFALRRQNFWGDPVIKNKDKKK